MQTIPVFCGKDCGGNACPLMATIGNGHVNRIFHNPAGGKYLRGCLRDFNLPWDLYAPGRILKPLMQVGECGSGRFLPGNRRRAFGVTLCVSRDQALSRGGT